jgi:hypothetical protein
VGVNQKPPWAETGVGSKGTTTGSQHVEYEYLWEYFQFGRGERIRTSGLYVPNVALYQAKLHPAKIDQILA